MEEKKKTIFNEKSTKIFEKKKIRRLKQIFEMFDSDNDGIISPSKIDITNVPIEILEVYTPILHELEELNQELNFEEFLSASEKLLQTLSVSDKAMIFASKKNDSSFHLNQNITFKVTKNIKNFIKKNSLN